VSYRIIVWGTGFVGKSVLRDLVDHPNYEIAAVIVNAAEKDGKDLGEILGGQDTGIRATRDSAAALALEADAVAYFGPSAMHAAINIENLTAALRAGKNVVDTSMGVFHNPRLTPKELLEPVEAACEQGGTSFFSGGIDPGFANDVLPLTLSGLCERWEEIRILEVINYATYDQPEVLFETMGFGKAMDHTPLLLAPGMLSIGWGGTIRLLAEGLGVELDEITQDFERLPATKAIHIGDHVVEPGTMAALRFEVRGVVGGKPAIVVEHVTRLDDDLAPEWPNGSGSYRIFIEGVPRMKVEFEFEDENGDHAVGGVILTATRIVNAIPAVCRAPAGPLSALDLPLITGRGLKRRSGI